jgi:hypothetical protein
MDAGIHRDIKKLPKKVSAITHQAENEGDLWKKTPQSWRCTLGQISVKPDKRVLFLGLLGKTLGKDPIQRSRKRSLF